MEISMVAPIIQFVDLQKIVKYKGIIIPLDEKKQVGCHVDNP